MTYVTAMLIELGLITRKYLTIRAGMVTNLLLRLLRCIVIKGTLR